MFQPQEKLTEKCWLGPVTGCEAPGGDGKAPEEGRSGRKRMSSEPPLQSVIINAERRESWGLDQETSSTMAAFKLRQGTLLLFGSWYFVFAGGKVTHGYSAGTLLCWIRPYQT